MRKIIIAMATLFAVNVANAEDYDNTAVKLTAKTDNYAVSIKAPETGATELAATTGVGPVDLTATWKRDGSTDDYALKVGKKIDIDVTPMYAGADAEFTFGDSYTKDTRTLVATPYIGFAKTFDKLTPFGEIGYSFKSTSNDVVDFSKNDSYIKVGASYALDANVDLGVSVKETRDTNFKNAGDKQAEVGLTFKF